MRIKNKIIPTLYANVILLLLTSCASSTDLTVEIVWNAANSESVLGEGAWKAGVYEEYDEIAVSGGSPRPLTEGLETTLKFTIEWPDNFLWYSAYIFKDNNEDDKVSASEWSDYEYVYVGKSSILEAEKKQSITLYGYSE